MIGRKLERFIAAQSKRGLFAWGSHDCGTMAADWVRTIEGRDPTPDRVRAPSMDTRSTLRYMRQHGDGLASVVTATLRRQPIPATMARDGDLLLFIGTVGVGGALGICSGRHAWVLQATGRPEPVPMDDAVMAWRVGYDPA